MLELIAGIGVFVHQRWARWLGFLLAIFGLVISVFSVSIGYALARGFTLPVIIGVVAVIGYILILLALLGGGSHFRRRVAPR